MTLEVEVIGRNDDGTLRYHYKSDGHLLITGPIQGQVQTKDGTTYDVSGPVIEVACDNPDHPDVRKHKNCHAHEVSELIGAHHTRHGHPEAPGYDHKKPDNHTKLREGVFALRGVEDPAKSKDA